MQLKPSLQGAHFIVAVLNVYVLILRTPSLGSNFIDLIIIIVR
jgi:hypothetical protein